MLKELAEDRSIDRPVVIGIVGPRGDEHTPPAAAVAEYPRHQPGSTAKLGEDGNGHSVADLPDQRPVGEEMRVPFGFPGAARAIPRCSPSRHVAGEQRRRHQLAMYG